MGQALYRKYRSKSLKEIIGQEHITDTLEQALKQGRISHAYLFTGPRGVGKTSIARILAHEINDLPYTDDSAHMDIIEIDAASNRRIDEIRELRDKVYVAPTSAKYKVYIIDEVHMLTKEAFNALLKTLEEPPAHVVFILATTDAHKLPDTIVSRTQRYTFKTVDTAKVVAHLADIAKQEKITVSPEALQLLAEHGEGSFRDSISLLDQAASHGKDLEVGDIQSLLGIPPTEAIATLLESLSSANPATVISQLNDLYNTGFQAAAIAKQLTQALRGQLIDNASNLPHSDALMLLGKLIEVPQSHDPERFLEVTLLSVLPKVPQSAPAVAVKPTPQLTPVTVPDAPIAAEPAPVPIEIPVEIKEEKSTKPKPTVGKLDENVWPSVLLALKQKHNTLYGVVRMAQPSFRSDGTLLLTFAFAFHEKRIKEASNRQKLADVIYELTGQVVTVDCALDKSVLPPKVSLEVAEVAPAGTDLTAISNIFGKAELLES